MKKLIFIIGLSLITTGAFAWNSEKEKSNEKKETLVRRCCVRISTDGKGQVWSARRCFDHSDSEQAHGAACALAQEDANQMKANAIMVNEITAE